MKSRVLILGAGFGGMELATLLSEALGEKADVTVIDKRDRFVFGYSRIDVMFGKTTLDEVGLSYASFIKPGIRLVKETITSIDAEAKRVTTDGGTYEADYLVIALGADYDMEATPGLTAHGNEFYSDEGADRLRTLLPGFTGGPIVVGICGFPYKCPPGPSECALTLHHYLTERGIREDCDITFVSPLSSPMPASAEMAQALMNSFEEFGIRLLRQRTVVRLEPSMAVLDDGTELPFSLFLGVPKHQPPKVVIESGLTEDDWVPIDLPTLETRFTDVYAIGDMAATGLPKSGTFAESAARSVSTSILAKLSGANVERNTGTGTCIVEYGDGRVSYAELDFLTGPKLEAIYHPPSIAGKTFKQGFDDTRRDRWFNR
ncbi:NAD(P)/FAD-dependent oxidoreductase [Yoonia sediminilitoris]|uniref:Sulfide:quinone oxidoreductase n=1 Tax=Yoonia sediminilitoris TaxID=1286148 RepID=A0A2T6K1B9_9RHOB|nr:FAD-dependent oxidoreductase [Yoonia sediminilitoris]PUB08447.1 sulfide:quinone oxidoreductase [Yoonia sediminilitoris]RCW89449.1 sulfide:quinone oxidoreductase [Yoonia sediminilitoris]